MEIEYSTRMIEARTSPCERGCESVIFEEFLRLAEKSRGWVPREPIGGISSLVQLLHRFLTTVAMLKNETGLCG